MRDQGLFPGCATSDFFAGCPSSDRGLRGRGWKFNLGFGLHSCKANSYYLNCIYSILFGREIAWSHCVRLVTDLFKLLLMLVTG